MAFSLSLSWSWYIFGSHLCCSAILTDPQTEDVLSYRRTTTARARNANTASRRQQGRISTASTRGEAASTLTSSSTRFRLESTNANANDASTSFSVGFWPNLAAECEAEGASPKHWQRTVLFSELQWWQLLQVLCHLCYWGAQMINTEIQMTTQEPSSWQLTGYYLVTNLNWLNRVLETVDNSVVRLDRHQWCVGADQGP